MRKNFDAAVRQLANYGFELKHQPIKNRKSYKAVSEFYIELYREFPILVRRKAKLQLKDCSIKLMLPLG